MPTTDVERPAVRPDSRSQVGALIAAARQGDESIGAPGADRSWDLSRLDKVISFHPPDMIITVETGLTLAAIKDTVEAQRLWLPLDTADGGGQTLAAFLAWDDSLGWLSHRHGTSRDWVMRLTACDDHGREVSSGAAVVKNVAGYQLAPLYIGARDAFGPLVEITFRLLPLPVRVTQAEWRANDYPPLLKVWRQSRRSTHPSARGEPWEALRLVRNQGRWRLEGFTRLPPETVTQWSGDDATITQVERLPRERHDDGFRPALRLQVLPTQLELLLAAASRLSVNLVCYPAAGVLTLDAADSPLIEPNLEELLRSNLPPGGRLQLLNGFAGSTSPLGDHEADEYGVLRKIKQILDPDEVFGPLPEAQWL